MDREVKGRFWRWYWGISASRIDFSLETKLLIFGILFTLWGAANVYWSLTT
jgi:hypothetical protein